MPIPLTYDSITLMKKNIHPAYFPKSTVTCACGNKLTTGSTQEKIEVEICSNCHPFFTGTEKIIDTAGRVEKFKKSMATAKATPRKAKAVVKRVKKEDK